MELTWLDDFLTLVRLQNFTRAAEERGTTQPAFSRRIQRLEGWMGTPLIDREKRAFVLTQAGTLFRDRALHLREEILDARRAVLSTSSHFKKPVRLFTTNTLATHFLTAWLKDQDFAQTSLVVASATGCLEAVRQKRADIALVPQFGNEGALAGLRVEQVGEDRLVLVIRKGQGKKIAVANGLIQGPVMAYAPGTLYGAAVAQLLAEKKLRIEGEPLCESASAEALLAQATAGLGAAWIPEMLCDDGVENVEAGKELFVSYRLLVARL